ncbi:MAG: hypothetical protein MUC78_02670 [Bacteroidales bacterium]|jgi:hypothetical protein|nr:hypothetical protein [Bacteroidales bacterium]
MKRNLLILVITMCSVSLLAQENMVTISGGYVFGNIDEISASTSGWRINGLYEFNPNAGKISHGLSVGYMQTQGSSSASDYKLSSWPIYYAPKYLFGNDSFNAFIKGALGMHFSNTERIALLSVEWDDFGFYGGAGAGITKYFGSLFITAEYEFAWMSNSSYKNGIVNTVMGGIGFRF